MKVELHLLQSFPPSCLNRDDTNTPKTCEFGGFRRGRISSQCLKRAMRQAFARDALMAPADTSVRTKRVVAALVDRLTKDGSREKDSAQQVAEFALRGAGFGVVESNSGEELLTQYLLFLPERQLDALANLLTSNWDILAAMANPEGKTPESAPVKAKKAKKIAKETFPAEIGKAMKGILKDARRAPEIGLFGRMITDRPEWNIDAACQVAHAITTHPVSVEFDFFTAVDDLKPEDTQGADMMGTVEFMSGCFYRFAVLDVDQLEGNLMGHPERSTGRVSPMTRSAVDAFLRAAISAIPTGKQNSMAAHTPPGFILGVARSAGQPWSLANAFLDPVRVRQTGHGRDLFRESVSALDSHLGGLARTYGSQGLVRAAWCSPLDGPDDFVQTLAPAAKALPEKVAARCASVDELIKMIVTDACGPEDA